MRAFDGKAVSVPFLAVFKQRLVLNLSVEIKCPSGFYQ